MHVNWNSEIQLPEEFDGISASVVGGYTRDKIMGRPSNDVDIVVSGVTLEDMRERGFTHIMSSDARKPVFEDSMGREVAIARSEMSTGDGHNDFEMDIVDPELNHSESLKLDLKRRDLTINAIAVNIRTGEVHDPFDGIEDIESGIIRHVSEAFAEDPLRVLRAARYSARFGFEIHEDTLDLMDELSDSIGSLPDDRFGQELIKNFSQAQNPREYFDILSQVNALEPAYPELAQLRQFPAGPTEYHKEGSAFEHSMRVLSEMNELRENDVVALLAALGHDLGKGVTGADESIPKQHHYGHENKGRQVATDMRKRLALNKEFKGVMSTASRVHGNLSELDDLNATTIIDMSKMIHDSPLSVSQVADLAISDAKGREPQGNVDRENVIEKLESGIDVIQNIGGLSALEKRGYEKSDIGNEIPGERVGNLIRQDRAEAFRENIS